MESRNNRIRLTHARGPPSPPIGSLLVALNKLMRTRSEVLGVGVSSGMHDEGLSVWGCWCWRWLTAMASGCSGSGSRSLSWLDSSCSLLCAVWCRAVACACAALQACANGGGWALKKMEAATIQYKQ